MKLSLLALTIALHPTLAAAQVRVQVRTPTVVVSAGTPAPRPAPVYVPAAYTPAPVYTPPPVYVERRPPCPAPGYVWMAGSYGYQDHHRVWIPGRWAARRVVAVAPAPRMIGRGWRVAQIERPRWENHDSRHGHRR